MAGAARVRDRGVPAERGATQYPPAMARTLFFALVLLSLAACTRRDGRGDVAEITADQCSNGIDDDRDGVVDCAEESCVGHCGATDLDGGPGADGGPLRFDGGPPSDRHVVSCGDPLDVVFVLDVSTSMADEAMAMRDGVTSIWNAATALTENVQFGLVVFVDDALAVGDCAPFADVATLQSELEEWRLYCATNRSPVSEVINMDCTENSLDAIHLAASSCPWREGSTRVLVHVTDDTFAERPSVLSESVFGDEGVPVQHTYAEVGSLLVEREIRVGAFAAPGAGEECGAGVSDNVGQGFHEPYRSMPALPTQTGGRAWSIREVRAGTLDMSTAINELIAAEYCTLF
jgi:hypothetical protein